MLLRSKDLINLPVYSESGQRLGKISDFEIESSSQNIIKYYVKPESIIKELVSRELVISAQQVISIDKEKMIVEDTLTKETEKEKVQLAKNNVAAVPINNTINFTPTPLQKTTTIK